ncbi:CBS domain-containing protein [Candidatus Sumerlaeota bacterium]|nr:CBS domain-containing protein [Candidatus Sumerlaeota bacterium]
MPPLARSAVVALLIVLPALVGAQSDVTPTAPPFDADTHAGVAWPYIVAAIIAALLNCLFTMSQTAIAALGPQAIEETGKGATPYDRFLKRFLARMPQLELQFQVAALIMLLTMILLLLHVFVGMFREIIGLGIAVAISLLVQLLIVEVLCRNIVLNNTRGSFRRIVPTASILSLWVTPLTFPSFLFGAFSGAKKQNIALTDMHLRLLPSLSGVDRVIDEEAFDMIDSVREFAEMTAEEIMTPRTKVYGIPDTMPPQEIVRNLQDTEFSRVVVYHETLDNILGTLLAKEVLLQRPENPLTLMRKAITASEKARLPELLRVIRANRTHLVVIVDEYGGMSGIVTLHDLFERIVGHIEDVEDQDELWIESVTPTTFRVNGRVELWEINEELNLDLDESVARTIAGFLFNSLGRVAQVGDQMQVPGAIIRVEKSIDKLADVLVIEKQNPARPAMNTEKAAS